MNLANGIKMIEKDPQSVEIKKELKAIEKHLGIKKETGKDSPSKGS